MKSSGRCRGLLLASLVLAVAGCNRSQRDGNVGTSQPNVIRVEGSDTMVNLAQAWAEEFKKVRPEVSVQVSGNGSGVGIASLSDGVADMANSSRQMKDKELARLQQNTGKAAVEHTVAMDALAVYVHKDNPLDSISLEELSEIYGDGGSITRWSQLGGNPACSSDEIIRVSRQNNSGTYYYFRDAVLGERDYRLGSLDQSGSKDVVALVSRTPCAIGYSGMGYHTDQVKWLKISRKKGEEGVAPSVESVRDGSYPIARPLLVYTLGEPTGIIKEYFDWIDSEVGQKIVLDLGYVPIIDPEAAAQDASEPAPATADPRASGNETAPGAQAAREDTSAAASDSQE